MRQLFSVCCLILTGFPPSNSNADSVENWARMKSQSPRGYVVFRAEKPPQIDGRIDESSWSNVPWTEPFVDIEGDRRPNPRFRTQAKLLWDDQYLYFGAKLEEPHVWGTLKEHDAVIFQDNDFEVFVDPDGDNHEYFEFEMNALNTGWDLFLPKPYKDGGKADNGWEIPGLKTAVHADGTINDPSDVDRGWTLEIAIPWSAFHRGERRHAPPAAGDQWRVNFSRVEWQVETVDGRYRKLPNRPENNWVWSPQGVIDMHRPERWGYVQFSAAPPGAEKFRPDPALAARDLLMGIYHHQRSFQSRHQRWADRLKDLDIALESDSKWPSPPVIRLTDDGYVATLLLPMESGDQQWHVRQDSRLWMAATEVPPSVSKRLERAGENREQIARALRDTPAEQQEGIQFLVAHMPESDLKSLSADFLRENVAYAYRAWNEAPWKDLLPKEVFLNDLLPYACVNEKREPWRRDFYERCRPIVQEAKSPSKAAALLNQQIFGMFKVRYSTKRSKADQCPSESIASGLASCTGLSVLLIDACRAVGVPARFAGTPLWSDKSGNHSWVEVWDQGWHFTGAAEPSGDKLDSVWFTARASAAKRDDTRHAIYAVSFKPTPLLFPMVWAPNHPDVFAVNVTDRYTRQQVELPVGSVSILVRVVEPASGDRLAAKVIVRRASGEIIFQGESNDERFDANDHLTVILPANEEFRIEALHQKRSAEVPLTAVKSGQLLTIPLTADAGNTGSTGVDRQSSSTAIRDLTDYLAQAADQRGAIADQPFAIVPLTRQDAELAQSLLWNDHVRRIRMTRAAEMKEGKLQFGDATMPFFMKVFGTKPAGGRSLFISMHGGGGAPKEVNDRQWKNQQRLYKIEEGIYVAPRAPTDTWNLWHQSHIDPLFDRLIENLIGLEDVDPNRVYLLGYSAGGDGVFQLAPRMADRFAAAAMMAGHPNETSPLGLRNLPFTIHMGGEDAAYNRNQVARDWEATLDVLRKQDPTGYPHLVKIYPEKSHWMDGEDAAALPWMAQYQRNPLPTKVVWKQDDVTHSRFYWLAVDDSPRQDRAEVVATRHQQRIDVRSEQVESVIVRLNDQMLDLDQPITVTSGDRKVLRATLRRTIGVLHKTLVERGDPKSLFCSEVVVPLKKLKE